MGPSPFLSNPKSSIHENRWIFEWGRLLFCQIQKAQFTKIDGFLNGAVSLYLSNPKSSIRYLTVQRATLTVRWLQQHEALHKHNQHVILKHCELGASPELVFYFQPTWLLLIFAEPTISAIRSTPKGEQLPRRPRTRPWCYRYAHPRLLGHLHLFGAADMLSAHLVVAIPPTTRVPNNGNFYKKT